MHTCEYYVTEFNKLCNVRSFIDLDVNKYVESPEFKESQALTQNLFINFIEDVCTNEGYLKAYADYLDCATPVEYYAYDLEDCDKDYIAIRTDNGYNRIICDVNRLTSTPYLEEFIINYVGRSYLDQYEYVADIDFGTPGVFDDIRYDIKSHPLDTTFLLGHNYDMCAPLYVVHDELSQYYEFLYKLAKHFEVYCPMESAKVFGLAEYAKRKWDKEMQEAEEAIRGDN